MSFKIEKIIILGSGSLAINCIRHILQLDIPLTIYEANITKIATLKNIAHEHCIKYINKEKKEIFSDLTAVRRKTIVFCISCNYIIPKDVIENEYLYIVNYHNSLLPKHPGRNAESWAIYDQDKVTGITWHWVDERVDAGDIIIQKEIQINESTSSISLLRLQNQLAFDSFKLIISNLLEGTISCFKQNIDLREKVHLSTDIPNDGFLDTTWDFDKVKAFLRAMDYGALRTMGQPKIIFNDNIYMWRKVLFLDVDTEFEGIKYNEEEKYIFIAKKGKAIKLIGVYTSGR